MRSSLMAAGLALALLACGSPPAPPAPDAGAETGDGTPPSLLASSPANHQQEVRPDSALSLEFSERVAPDTFLLEITPPIELSSIRWEFEDTVVSLVPAGVLIPLQTYVVRGSVSDVSGARGTFSFSFQVSDQDVVAPALVTSTPEHGASGVPLDALVSLTFSEPIDISTLEVTTAPPVELGTPSWNAALDAVSFPEATPFAASRTYALSVSARDLAANALPATEIVFTTLTPNDTVAPTVESASPPPSSTGVPVSTRIAVHFSEPMDPSSSAAFSITPMIACAVSWDVTGSLLTCDPTSPLAASTGYVVKVDTRAKDHAQNALAQTYSFSFVTGSAPDATPPTLLKSTPANGAQGASRTANLVLEFSEPMDKASTQAALKITAPAHAAGGTLSWDASGKVLTYDPPVTLAYGDTLSWALEAGAMDLAQNAIAAAASGSFRTLRLTTVNLTTNGDGHVRNDASVCGGCSNLAVGDIASGLAYRTFIGFSLSSLPADLSRITAATLYVYQHTCEGSPYASLGTLRAESVNYGPSIDSADFGTAVLGGRVANVATSCGGARWLSANVLGAVTDDWTARGTRANRSQHRLRFPTNQNGDGAADRILLYSVNAGTRAPYLRIAYEHP